MFAFSFKNKWHSIVKWISLYTLKFYICSKTTLPSLWGPTFYRIREGLHSRVQRYLLQLIHIINLVYRPLPAICLSIVKNLRMFSVATKTCQLFFKEKPEWIHTSMYYLLKETFCTLRSLHLILPVYYIPFVCIFDNVQKQICNSIFISHIVGRYA